MPSTAPKTSTRARPKAPTRSSTSQSESARLADANCGAEPWRDWGPYLSERAWGTVREDYSADGDAWSFFPHDHARSRVYRWNEDGMAGFCDETQNWCLSLGLWNGVDPILKERMFGLAGPQGNHGEDVKEYWWYLDGTPTHSWNTWRYHYPQREFPYGDLVAENARRGKLEPEYELVDTGIFDDDRYWVVTVDYAKAAPRDLLMRITVENAGPDEATLACAADALVPQHLVVGVRRPPETDPAAGRQPDRRQPLEVRAAGAGRRRRPGAVVLRERDQQRTAVRQQQHHAVPEGRHQRPRRARRQHGQPARPRAPRPRCTTR